MKCHKYILIDNQEMCFTDYILSRKYYSSKKACETAVAKEHCFHVVGAFAKSKQTGRIAEILTEHEI